MKAFIARHWLTILYLFIIALALPFILPGPIQQCHDALIESR